MIKASAGGGGKGMRVCHNAVTLIGAMMTAKSEAEASFGNSDVYMEKYIEEPRHVAASRPGEDLVPRVNALLAKPIKGHLHNGRLHDAGRGDRRNR